MFNVYVIPFEKIDFVFLFYLLNSKTQCMLIFLDNIMMIHFKNILAIF